MALISLANARAHLFNPDADAVDIQQKAEHASALVLARCNTTEYRRTLTTTWTDATVPAEVQSAVLLVLSFLWEHRGDGQMPDANFWASIDALIFSHRDPVVA